MVVILPMRAVSRPGRRLVVWLAACWLALGGICQPATAAGDEPPPANPSANPLDAERAFSYLRAVCDLGPRPSGSDAMRRQQQLIVAHFRDLGRPVDRQAFLARNPRGGPRVPMANLIARYRPELPERVLLCCHYDTRPLPDQDPNPRARRSGTFVGANDGGSGVAVLMELAHHLAAVEGDLRVGVDLVFLDGEELVYRERDPYFLGSTWFAQQYRKRQESGTATFRYRAGVLLDMVGDADLQLYQERNSWLWRDTRPIVREVWGTAARLGVEEFIPRTKHQVNDDHTKLRNIGRIPTCDIIDFDYPYWHTEGDLPRRCSGESLAKVGWVVLEWVRSQTSEP